MCGIAGAALPASVDAERAVARMCDQMIARGPDDAGVVLLDAPPVAVALGNRRLAIIDPSPAGHQPMRDERGNAIVFNGMIYNHRELRAQLVAEGERFASDCDTEVVLRAFGRWGTACVRRLRGMFAFVVWDASTRGLFMARDRLGIKPLYYHRHGDVLLFASQVKALLATGHIAPRLSQAGIASYLAYGAVTEPLTAIEGVRALPAGHTATLRDGHLAIEPYWSPPPVMPTSMTREKASCQLRERLQDCVAGHLAADAPLGVFLSGGIDSSVLAALAARDVRHLRTLSVVFDDPAYSEAPYMELVARHIGSDHLAITLRPDDVLAWRDDIFAAMDQPTFDGLNTYAVARAASSAGLKVALSGLGADELFDGYGLVGRVQSLERVRRLLPPPVATIASRAAALHNGNREKLSAWLSGRAGADAYDLLRRLFLDDEVARMSPAGAWRQPSPGGPPGDVHARVSARDLAGYTKNVLLRDTDAMSMAHGLEVRVPFLDHTLVEWVLSLPGDLKAGGGKALLAEATRDLLPPRILTRRKQGFALPIGRWMAGALREEVEATLRRPPAILDTVFDGGAASRVWQDFARDGRRWHRPWALYALCRWAATVAVPVGSAV
ncbi:MAG TPA: asparagine synthase (glutamine-hydrolyzing) [Dehalococcoidia bacterium]|nr:asparagine synthase (glutamine-hydrolyzing) [Dehalococcoidia bacterium]